MPNTPKSARKFYYVSLVDSLSWHSLAKSVLNLLNALQNSDFANPLQLLSTNGHVFSITKKIESIRQEFTQIFFNFWTPAHIFSLFPSLREGVYLLSIANFSTIALDPIHSKFLKD